MDKVKFVITDYIHPDLNWEKEQCRELGVDFEYYQKKPAGPQELLDVCADADVILINMAKFDEEVINGLENCKLLMRHGIGYDNIDVEACNKKGIAVGYFPEYCVKEVAEQAIMLIMACQRKLGQQVEKVRKVTEEGYKDYMSVAPIYRLHGKTVGIIGFGRIGRTVYRMLQGFGVEFLIDDPYLTDEVKEKFGIETVSLEKLLKESDVVTIHVPLNIPETQHLIDEPQLNMMKETAILINTSRGPVVNLDALNKALEESKLAHAGIDVYETGTAKPDLGLIHNDKAICTPHMGWLSVESGWEIRKSYIGDVKRFLNKQGPVHQVNPQIPVRFE
jgi:D-3-phosphoglycerate dehydrogenase